MQEFTLRGRGPNTMTIESLNDMRDFLASNSDQPILITGEGKAFSAGLDIDAMIETDPRQVAEAIAVAAEAVFLHPAPVVAAVNGHAIAGGCLLLQTCDLRICSDEDTIKIGMPGVALGINYPPKLLRILRYRIPSHTIDRVLLEAGNHDPTAALTLGLIDEVVSDVMTTARDRLAKLARHPAQAYAEAKLALRGGVLDIPPDEQKRFDLMAERHWSADSLSSNRSDKAS